MGSPKPLASLSSGLLARPGQAKPAMRPQVFAYAAAEDLGWNDMGAAQPEAELAPVPTPSPAPVPPVLVERAQLDVAITAAAESKVSARQPRSAVAEAGHKAAFTLRLDAARHLRLRLASAIAGRSSQQLLVAALDAYLDTRPQVETLARQLPATQVLSGEKTQ